ncbi:imidazolonepropionase [Phycisphaerae bacterium RAS1]|nr:imidazolonepropionase [Phycisphaerae bacterium RAS1]
MKTARTIALSLALVAFVAAAAAEDAAIRAGRVWTGKGPALENALIVIRDGKVVSVAAGANAPDGVKTLKYEEMVVTPGLVDAACVIDPEIPQVASLRDFGMCLRCAAAHRLHLTADPALGASVDGCPRCAAAHAGHAARKSMQPTSAQFWAKLAAASEATEHDHAAGDACGPGCSGPRTLEDFAELVSSGPSANLTWAEQSSEVTPHCSVLDAVNFSSRDFRVLLSSGVTTIYVSPDTAAVIGARGAVVKTGGPLAGRVVRKQDSVLAAMGADPVRRGRFNNLPPGRGGDVSFMTRRPTTRMGVDFVFRKAFYDAMRVAEGMELHGADAPPAPAVPVLQEILAGKTPLRVQARLQHDILNALRLAREFKLSMTLQEAVEAYKCLDQIKAAGFPLIYGPIFDRPSGWRAFTGEATEPRLTTPAALRDAGIRFCLTASEGRDESGLVRQAMVAARYGLSEDDALAAVTRVPAELMGLAERVGTLAAGADADLVVWTGDPLDATSRVKMVMIEGKVVYEE